MTKAWPIYTNANLCFDKKKNRKLAKKAKPTFLWYNIFWEKRVSAEEWHSCHSKKEKNGFKQRVASWQKMRHIF